MSDSTAPISVIVPCLNAERTLGAALESVFVQTAPPLEVLLIDDRSTDRSVEVARSFGPRVRVLTNPARGPGAARRFGVTEAVGTYIAFIDADDTIEPTKHERQLAVLEAADPYTFVHTGSMMRYVDGRRASYIREGAEQAVGRCTRTVFERNPICGASTMMRRSTILELGNYDAVLFGTEDFGLSLVASTRCDFVYVPDPLYVMVQHTSNITRRRCHMLYYHWLAQELFRLKCPDAFAALGEESVRRFMTEPVIGAVREAYWARDGRDYRRLLRLAMRLSPHDTQLRRLWRRRFVPMSALRAWDRVSARRRPSSAEVLPG
jgi:glycosyltransferase involved in cell wall biosynthesis